MNTRIAVAYMRVSTNDQHLSVEAQRAAIEAWAAREGIQVAAWHLDHGVSGRAELADRPGLVAALADLRAAAAGVLVVLRRDRLARDVATAIAIERAVEMCGARVRSADGVGDGETATDVLVRRILDAVAEHERALIALRTKAALEAKRARGERVSRHAPYGFRLAPDGVRLERDEEEQRTIGRACELRSSGLSLRAVSAALAAEGRLSRASTPFAPLAISRMIETAPHADVATAAE